VGVGVLSVLGGRNAGVATAGPGCAGRAAGACVAGAAAWTGADWTGADGVVAGALCCGRADGGADGGADGAGARVDVLAGEAGLDSFSLSRLSTGASTVEEADRTNSPMSFNIVRTVLLSTPSSFASS
jgi:hypothetical protein